MKLIAKCLLCLFVAALVLPVSAYADDTKTYEIKELGMTLKIPSDMDVLTQNMAEDDPALGAFSLTAQQANEELQSSDMYLFACSKSGSYGIAVAAKPSDYAKTTGKTSGLTDQMRSDLKDFLQKSYENRGDTNISFSQYDTPNTNYLVACHKQLNSDGLATYFIEYHTLCGGQEINIVLSSNDGPPPKERETLLRNIIDDAVYGPIINVSTPTPVPTATPAQSAAKQTPVAKSPEPVPTAVVAAAQPAVSQPSDGAQAAAAAIQWVLTFLASLFLTIALYTMPIVVYRYAIRKEPVPPPLARKIAIIYGIVVFVGVLALNYLLSGKASSGGVLLWSFVNYYILKSGMPRQAEPAPVDPADFDLEAYLRRREQTSGTPGQTAKPAAEVRYCIKCGRKLLPSSFYCSTCGAKIDGSADR